MKILIQILPHTIFGHWEWDGLNNSQDFIVQQIVKNYTRQKRKDGKAIKNRLWGALISSSQVFALKTLQLIKTKWLFLFSSEGHRESFGKASFTVRERLYSRTSLHMEDRVTELKGSTHSLHLSKTTPILPSWTWTAGTGLRAGFFLLILSACSAVKAIPITQKRYGETVSFPFPSVDCKHWKNTSIKHFFLYQGNGCYSFYLLSMTIWERIWLFKHLPHSLVHSV